MGRSLRVFAAAALALLLGACASLPPRGELPASFAPAPAAASTLARHAHALVAGRAAGESGFHLLLQPDAALQARLDLIERAERTLDVQYYVFEMGDIGAEVLGALRRAAARG